jgi:hypothetical protein
LSDDFGRRRRPLLASSPLRFQAHNVHRNYRTNRAKDRSLR